MSKKDAVDLMVGAVSYIDSKMGKSYRWLIMANFGVVAILRKFDWLRYWRVRKKYRPWEVMR